MFTLNGLINPVFLAPVDAEWSDWSQWSDCTKPCGTGTQEKSRTCSEAENGGVNRCADGDDVMNQDCNTEECPGKTCMITSVEFFIYIRDRLFLGRPNNLFVLLM